MEVLGFTYIGGMENKMKKNVGHEMETGVVQGS